MSNLLAQIAMPATANVPNAFIQGQQQATQEQQQVAQEQRQVAQEGRAVAQEGRAVAQGQQQQLNLEASRVKQQREKIAYDMLSAFAAGPGSTRESLLSSLANAPEVDAATKQVATDMLSTPEGSERDTKLLKAIEFFQQAGYLPPPKAPVKTPEQQERELKVQEKRANIEEQQVNVRQQELEARIGADSTVNKSALGKLIAEMENLPAGSPHKASYEAKIKEYSGLDAGSGTLTQLGKLIKERDMLEPGSNERVVYDAKIEEMTSGKGGALIQTQAEKLAKQVVEGRLDPNKISKRGGLQQTVFATIEDNYPETNLVELEANARFKNTAGNLQSRALINGVTPILESLMAAGETLHNTRFPLINKAVNFAKEQTGDADIVAFNNLRDDAVAETERILLGSGVLSDTKYIRAVGNVNSAQSYPQLKAAVAQLEFVIEARLEALDLAPFGEASSELKDQVKRKKQNDPLGIR
jgi:hypothetical protein